MSWSSARTCSAPTPDETQTLPTDAYYDALDQIAQAPVGQATLGIETLLFHAAETERLLEREGTGPLSEAHIRWLEHELARQTVDLSFRLVTEDGRVLGALQQQVALKTKQHLLLEDTDTLETIEVSGKTKRVGLHHLWSRF